MNTENNSLLYSILLSMSAFKSDFNSYELTEEDLKYMYDSKLNDCQVTIYLKVIEWLSMGKSYEEIFELLDKIDLKEYKELASEKQDYLQRRVKKDLCLRKYNEGKREKKYE